MTPARPLHIREAEAGDLDALVALLSDNAMSAREDPGRRPDYAAALAEIASTAGNTVLVAVHDGRVMGMCQLLIFRHLQHQGGRCAELESVFVRQDKRGEGIGGQLVDAAVERARVEGCYRVQLTSNQARTAAHRFWVRQGFEPSHLGFKRYLTERGG